MKIFNSIITPILLYGSEREYPLAPYLLKVKDPKQRQTLGQYRISAHSLEIETGRHRQNWKPREMRLCQRCELGEVCERHRQTQTELEAPGDETVPAM
ncbi:hypothetical protein FKM82_027245 [Ascaphus truei]